MPTSPQHEMIPVPRNRLLVIDSNFVVQWEQNRVQDLLTGRYYMYDASQAANIATDFELSQLKRVGMVLNYDEEYVYLNPQFETLHHISQRTYYLNTTLPKNRQQEVREEVKNAGLSDQFAVRVQERFVIIRRRDGLPFNTFDSAEQARQTLLTALPHLLGKTVVAFIETLPVQD